MKRNIKFLVSTLVLTGALSLFGGSKCNAYTEASVSTETTAETSQVTDWDKYYKSKVGKRMKGYICADGEVDTYYTQTEKYYFANSNKKITRLDSKTVQFNGKRWYLITDDGFAKFDDKDAVISYKGITNKYNSTKGPKDIGKYNVICTYTKNGDTKSVVLTTLTIKSSYKYKVTKNKKYIYFNDGKEINKPSKLKIVINNKWVTLKSKNGKYSVSKLKNLIKSDKSRVLHKPNKILNDQMFNVYVKIGNKYYKTIGYNK